MGKGHDDVTEHDEEDRVRKNVMDKGCSGSPRHGEKPEPLQHRPRDEHHEYRCADEDGVELLARVELVRLDLGLSECAQPADLVAGPVVDSSHVVAHCLAPRSDERHDDWQRERETAPEVDHLNHVPRHDDAKERAEVERDRSEHESEEQERIHPVGAWADVCVSVISGQPGVGVVRTGGAVEPTIDRITVLLPESSLDRIDHPYPRQPLQ